MTIWKSKTSSNKTCTVTIIAFSFSITKAYIFQIPINILSIKHACVPKKKTYKISHPCLSPLTHSQATVVVKLLNICWPTMHQFKRATKVAFIHCTMRAHLAMRMLSDCYWKPVLVQIRPTIGTIRHCMRQLAREKSMCALVSELHERKIHLLIPHWPWNKLFFEQQQKSSNQN